MWYAAWLEASRSSFTVGFLKHQLPEDGFDGFGGPSSAEELHGVQGVVAVGVDEVERAGEPFAVALEPSV